MCSFSGSGGNLFIKVGTCLITCIIDEGSIEYEGGGSREFCLCFTLPDTNIAPENQWLEDVFPLEIVHF